MTDERTLIARLEAANTAELAQLILQASVEEEKVLRIYLGSARFRRLRNLVLRQEMVRDERRNQPRLNVVVIPGTLGCEMTSIDHQQHRERLWLSPSQIVAGHLGRLRLDHNGLTEVDRSYTIQITGIMKRYYGELLLSLAEQHHVYAFWYDWRKDMRLAAAQLQANIDNWFPAGEPVHLVAHAAGGLVARAYIHQFPERWRLGGSKLIMLGTPNYGIYTTPQAITGHLGLLQWIDMLDTRHDRTDFREIIKSFPGLYQLLPNPTIDTELTALYLATTYGAELNVPQDHLSSALLFHQQLDSAPVDPERMIYLAGHYQPTFVGVRLDKLRNFTVSRQPDPARESAYIQQTYHFGVNGDGTVAHPLGVLRTCDGDYVPAYYTNALHGDLCSHPKILMAIHELLTAARAPSPGATFCGLQPLTAELINERRESEVRRLWEKAETTSAIDPRSKERKAFEAMVRRVNSRGEQGATRHFISVEERDIEERLAFGFLSGETDRATLSFRLIDLGVPTIKINLVSADITDHELDLPAMIQPVDALAVGHYSGSKPYGILRTLDYKISRALEGYLISDRDENVDEELPSRQAARAHDADLLITQYTQRGTIRAELAQTFFLVDPRNTTRLITIAGMGEPGRFGTPELAVLVRELCWSLGRMGKKHLATVLIGVGRDNLTVADAVAGWVRGIKLAITGMTKTDKEEKRARALEEITFFITDPRKVLAFDEILHREQERLQQQKRLDIRYTPLDPTTRATYALDAVDYVKRQMEQQLTAQAGQLGVNELAPTRITVSVEGKKYRFGAITEHASIPEREIPLDPALVCRANDELAAEADPDRQLDLGQFMQRLLIPADLRSQLSTNAPLVMMLDQNTARIHWELLAQSELTGEHGDGLPQDEPYLRFLGTSRGFTRQLRTIHAPPPEPPPPVQRQLRVLIVADPAEDAHLPGAEEEGIAVADLFDQFNIVHAHSVTKNRVEVVRLFGPREATRTTVLRHLMMRTYDVLHFAGHCVYDKANPAASGWIFSNGERLSAYEFTRVDRSPAFVFSNACESGITPARSDERSVDLAPSFAESFFARGVSNFVCTAWPVDDRAARDFALILYAGLLGLEPLRMVAPPSLLHSTAFRAVKPLPMYVAMMAARRAIAVPPSDTRTWGAYQHYGNPYFRFFDPAGIGGEPAGTQSDRPVQAEAQAPAAPAPVDATAVPAGAGAVGSAPAHPVKPARARHRQRKGAPAHANGVARTTIAPG